VRVATWNIKQAVAPRKPLGDLWSWAAERLTPDIVVFTEGKVPKGGPPPGWTAQWLEGGIGPRRRWGTVIAGRGVELRPISAVRSRFRTRHLTHRWPAAVQVCEVVRDGTMWGAVVGVYGLTVNLDGASVGHGRYAVPAMLEEIEPVVRTYDNVVVAGDLNLWPKDLPRQFTDLGLIDLVESTASTRPALEGCCGCSMGARCGHMWTHRNGNSPRAAVQQIDYIFASRDLAATCSLVRGGIADFPDAWDVSDHAPIVADFDMGS